MKVLIGQGGIHQKFLLSAEASEQVTSPWYPSASVHVRDCFKLTWKGSTKKNQKYFILKFFFIIYIERWKAFKKKKETKKTTQTLNKNPQCFYFPNGCFLHREVLHETISTLCGDSAKSWSLNSTMNPQCSFQRHQATYLTICVKVIKVDQELRNGVHLPRPGSAGKSIFSDTNVPHHPLRQKTPNVFDHGPLTPLASAE